MLLAVLKTIQMVIAVQGLTPYGGRPQPSAGRVRLAPNSSIRGPGIQIGFFPRILGVLVTIGGIAHVAASLFPLLAPPNPNVVGLVSDGLGALGEGSMIAWLIIKNSKVKSSDAPASR